MDGRFHIEGTEDFGYNIYNRSLFTFYIFMNTVKVVCDRYNCASVWDLKGYMAHFCYLRLKSFNTLINICRERQDYISANCILRMLGDSVAVFHLLYMERDSDLRWFRHALYVKDGCERNMAVLPDDDTNRETMPDGEFRVFKEQVRHNRALRKRILNQAQAILDQSPLKERDKEAFDKIVADRNWKFKDFIFSKSPKSNQYQWRELYDRIGMCEGYDVLSYISQYAHGLSMSNLVMGMNDSNLDGIISTAFSLIKRLNKYMLELFYDDYDSIMDGLLKTDMRDKILACYDDQHRPSLEKWNQRINDTKTRKEIIW